MKKVNQDPFSNGTDFMIWEEHNCNKCIKASQPRDGGTRYTNADKHNMPNKCSIQRDIITRMACDEPINEQTVTICNDFTMHGKLCPYMKTERKKYQKKDKQQTTLEL
jgi:hypothetical protein